MQHFIVGLMFVIIIANAGWFVFFYNKTVNKKTKIEDRWKNIYDLIKLKYYIMENFVKKTHCVVNHEEEIRIWLAHSRSKLLKAQTPVEAIKISGELKEFLKTFSIDKTWNKDLEADPDFLQICIQIKKLDEKLALKQRIFKEEVFLYNKSINTFPNAIAAKIMNIRELHWGDS